MPAVQSIETRQLQIPAGAVTLPADVVFPVDALGIVLFAHGSGSSRLSRRNRYVAGELNAGGVATVLADLLTEAEEEHDLAGGTLRFDIPMLTERLVHIADWLQLYAPASTLPLGLFGASTGAAAALDAAAHRPEVVRAIVSRGGRPDLARGLDRIEAPTLLIVGGKDPAVLDLNEYALRRLHCVRKLEVVSGATHLFEEKGALERVAVAARDWFLRYLPAR